MSIIRLYFLDGNRTSIAGQAIRRASLGAWQTHVGAILPDGRAIAAHWTEGVRVLDPNKDEIWTKRVDVLIPVTDEQSAAHTAWLLKQVGKPYDKEAIADMFEGAIRGVANPISDWASWICSTLQHQGLLEPGVEVFKWHPNPIRMTMPHELMFACSGIKNTQVIYV
jgi:hypothetical protein